MIKGRGTSSAGREALIFGLSFENLKRLKDGKPIVVHGEEMGINYEIIIFAGETEEKMAAMICNPDTIVTTVPRKKRN